jgi:hypothetical protein
MTKRGRGIRHHVILNMKSEKELTVEHRIIPCPHLLDRNNLLSSFLLSSIIIMTIIEDICSNQVVDLHLQDVPAEYFGETSELIAALKDNTSIETIRFDKDFIACVFGKERGEVLDQVAKLPNLKEVHLGDAGLMVEAIVTLLKNAKSLRKISLHRLVMQGTQKDFDGLEATLYQHGALKDFQMEDCVASNDNIDMGKIMNAGKNFNSTSIDDPTHSKNSAIAA